MNTISASTEFYTESPFRYQHFDLKQFKILRRGQPILDFDAAEKWRFYVSSMKARNLQDGISSIWFDNFRDHHVLVFDLTLMRGATEGCHHPELVGEPLRLELNFTYLLKHVTGLIVLGEGLSLVAVDKFDFVGKEI